MRKLVLVLLFVFFFSSLSIPVYNGVYKRDTACGTGCDCWDEAQVIFQDENAVPVFLFNGTFNGDCEGQIGYAESAYTYKTFYDSDIWYHFYQDEQNGYVNVTGGPCCSYGNYTITTSTSYWNNQTQYWQKNLMIVNNDKPYCSYHMKNITKPVYQRPSTPTPSNQSNSTSPKIFEGIYNRSEACGCCCWNEVQITYQGGKYPNYVFNGTFSGQNCGYYYFAKANLSFYGSSSRFHKELNQNYLNLYGGIGDYQYYYNSKNWTIFVSENSSIIFTDKINPQCSYSLANITNEVYNNNYYYNNDTDNNTDYNNDTYNAYPSPYNGQYGPVENISNPRVLNGQYNISGQCPSQCACFENLNITFDYLPWMQYIGYNFQGIFGDFYSYANFTQYFNGTYDDLVNELSYQYVNVTNYTIFINYYTNYSTEYYNYGKRAQEITINYWWTNCSYSLVRIGDPYVQYEEEPIYFYSNANNNDNMMNNYTNSSSNYTNANFSNYTYTNTSNYTYPNNANYTYANDSSSNYTNATVYSPYDFDGYYSRTTNCPEGCCCYNFVSVNYVQYGDYLNTFLLNGTYSGSGCSRKKSYQPVNFTYTGYPQNMFWNFTSQGYAPFLEAWMGNYGSNYTFSLNITNSSDYIQVYNVNQPQCTYSLENITYYVPPTPNNNNSYNNNSFNNNSYNNNSFNNNSFNNNSFNNNSYNNNSFNNNSSNNNSNNNFNYPSTDGVFDYFDGNYRINTPCDYSAGCGCWSDMSLTNFDADSDNGEPYFILNGTYRTGRNYNYAYKTEKLYYPFQGVYASSVTLNSANNGTVITVNTGDSHYNPNSQYYYNDIQIQNVLQPDCIYNMTNLTGLNQGYDDISNSIQLQLGKLAGRLRV